jgi:hypothetical protein
MDILYSGYFYLIRTFGNENRNSWLNIAHCILAVVYHFLFSGFRVMQSIIESPRFFGVDLFLLLIEKVLHDPGTIGS